MNKWQWRVIVSVLFALSLVLVLSAGTAVAQTKEICNDGIDNDGDKFIDCADSDCANDAACKKPGTGCSPGFYKNHLTVWVGICCNDTTSDPSCAELSEALTCKGSDASCGRSAAAAFLDACTGCSE